MARFIMCMLFSVIIIAVVFVHFTTAQTVHVVGDDMGWTIPPNGATAYSNWAANKRFLVGDILVFNFTTNEHDVLRVPRASFDQCSDYNPIGNMLTNGPTNVTLNSTGEQYYICTLGRHCEVGQRLAITVLADSGSPLPAPSPTTPTTPSPTSGTPADCAPTPTSGPTAGFTPPTSVPGSNGSSSSGVVLVNLLVSMLVIVMGLIL
ncbi:glucan endo-1,3-beta-glucosidase 14-like [Hibiscus syriacus]|uniref:Glucan endo-1,3-beta-glucosidase 14-like n=1 Tax=Hibiscus syriacus TaxID=106335 RepID=A0A6A3BWB8_HIBSY|nr:umecyanin-like [Hibiscus syriacus]KAE8721150.1 glucan endo-1,3-beta-glucosidase 14-like [Hibiscus syriacus]